MKRQTQQGIDKYDKKGIEQGIGQPLPFGAALFGEKRNSQWNHRKHTRGKQGDQSTKKAEQKDIPN